MVALFAGTVVACGGGDAVKLPKIPALLPTGGVSTASSTCTALARASVVAEDQTYLDRLTNKYDSESILNIFGSYGSEFSSTSIYNTTYGRYGSRYSSYSAFNSHTSTPPMVYVGTTAVAYVTKNTAKMFRLDPDTLRGYNFP